MDFWVAAGLVLGVVGIGVSIYYGRHAPGASSSGARVEVRTTNAIPVYDLPGGAQDLGDHHVAVEAVNSGDQAVTLPGWGVKLPGDRRVVMTRPVSWSTPLPHRLEPGAPAAQFVMPADELRRLHRPDGIPFDSMHGYVTLADGAEVIATAPIPLA